MKNIFSDDLLRSENWTSHPTQWLKPWVSLKWSVFKTFHGKKSSKFENFIKIRLVVTMILIKVWRKLLEFHTKFENMSHLNFSIAYFCAEAHYTHFANFVWNLRKFRQTLINISVTSNRILLIVFQKTFRKYNYLIIKTYKLQTLQ